MKNWIFIAAFAVGCITLIVCVAMYFGHDNAIVTGAVSGITGIVAGFAGYFAGKLRAGTTKANGNKKADSGS